MQLLPLVMSAYENINSLRTICNSSQPSRKASTAFTSTAGVASVHLLTGSDHLSSLNSTLSLNQEKKEKSTLVTQMLKNLPITRETQVPSLGLEESPEK